jgi:hypothetical protein
MKVAVFISGPYRYLDYVIKQITPSFSDEMEYDIYIHLWENDQGNKVRGLDVNDSKVDIIRNNKSVKTIIIENQKTEEETLEFISSNVKNFDRKSVKGHSALTAMLGMFEAINILHGKAMESGIKYDYILRLRTDISFHVKNIIPKTPKNEIYISKNPLISFNQVSDHTMLLPFKDFHKIWGNDNNSINFLNEYYYCNFNPEILLGERIQRNKLNTLHGWRRFVDYNVVYLKHHTLEPVIYEKLSPEGMFNFYLNFYQKISTNFTYIRLLTRNYISLLFNK